VASDYRPAREIGGDFFDVFPVLEPSLPDQLALVIADVSGKGISAALLMAFLRPVIRAAIDHTGDPVEALERVNRILVEERQTGMFVTVLCGVLDLRRGELRFASAGHEAPILIPADGSEPRAAPDGGPLIGLFPRLGLEEQRLAIGPGDLLVLYTDGVTDAISPAGERYGDDRFAARLGSGARAADADAVVQAVVADVLSFQGDALPADDLALLVLKRPLGTRAGGIRRRGGR
jgi:sigma-B regulation protein RsbU (phosphoserine phosphatase)